MAPKQAGKAPKGAGTKKAGKALKQAGTAAKREVSNEHSAAPCGQSFSNRGGSFPKMRNTFITKQV